jgi:hypothetical protein
MGTNTFFSQVHLNFFETEFIFRVYVTSGLDGVGKIPKENISCHFTNQSLELKVADLNSSNYR